jgi:hypothetical protein
MPWPNRSPRRRRPWRSRRSTRRPTPRAQRREGYEPNRETRGTEAADKLRDQTKQQPTGWYGEGGCARGFNRFAGETDDGAAHETNTIVYCRMQITAPFA